jgi:hypothetical protein
VAQPTKNSKTNKVIIAGIICAAILVGAIIGAYIYYSDLNKPTLPPDKFVPSLVGVDLQLSDDRTNSSAPFLHVTGRIHNQGNGTANNITIHVYAIQDVNTTAIDTTKSLESIAAGEYQTIDLSFAYTGKALSAYNEPELAWTS